MTHAKRETRQQPLKKKGVSNPPGLLDGQLGFSWPMEAQAHLEQGVPVVNGVLGQSVEGPGTGTLLAGPQGAGLRKPNLPRMRSCWSGRQ